MKLASIEKLVKRIAMSFPDTTEDHPWGDTVMKVNGKGFVFMGSAHEDREKWGFSVKLPHSAIAVLELPNAEPTGYGLGKHGWVSVTFGDGDNVDEPWIRALITESWRAVAPKRMVKAYGD